MSSTRLFATPARVTVFALVAALLAGLLALAPTAPANAAGGVNLTVTATSKAGTLLSGLTVSAYPTVNRSYHQTLPAISATAVSGKPGQYRFVGLEQSVDYAIYFERTGAGAFDQFLGGTSYVTDAELYAQTSAGEYTLSASLATNSVITGKVVGARGVPLRSVTVTAYQFSGDGWVEFDTGITGSTGLYSLRNLDPGSYKLEFDAPDGVNYLTGFSGSKSTFDAATPVYVGLGATTTTNVALAVGGAIAGKARFVYSSSDIANYFGIDPGHFPADGIRAYAYRLNPPNGIGFPGIDWNYAPVRSTLSGTTGAWLIAGLPTGDYVVKLYDEKYAYSKDRWVGIGGAAIWPSNAEVFSVVAGTTRTGTSWSILPANADSPTASATLTVRNALNQPVSGAGVVVFSNDDEDYYIDCEWVSETDCVPLTTNASGQITLTRMPIGTFDVIVSHPSYPTLSVSRSTASNTATSWSVQFQAQTALDWVTTPFVTTLGSTSVVGETYMVTANTTLDDGTGVEADVSYEYQWYRDGRRIVGATGVNYESRSADVGHELSVIVRAAQNNDRFFGADRAIVEMAVAGTVLPGDQLVNTVAPWISSPTAAAPRVTLTANSGVWSEIGVRFQYQWLRDGLPIPGATSRTYLLTEPDAATLITVQLTAIKPGHPDSAPTTSAAVSVGQLIGLKQTVLSATSKTTVGVAVGSTKYSVTAGRWNLIGVTPSYEWRVDGVSVGSGASVILDTASTKDQVIEVIVIGEKTGWVTSQRTVLAQKGSQPTFVTVSDDTLSTPVDGTSETQVGTVLRATPAVTFPYLGGGTVVTKYLWQRSTNGSTLWTTIPGAVAATYALTAADTNKFVRAVVTTTSSLYTLPQAVGPAGKAILNPAIVDAGAPDYDVVGTGQVTTVHTASLVGAWGAPGVSLTYQWFLCGDACSNPTAVAGATRSTWTPLTTAAGKFAFVKVTASKPGFAPLTATSNIRPITAVTQAFPLVAPSYASGLNGEGDAVIGKPLSVKAGTWDLPGVVRTYLWVQCEVVEVGDCTDGNEFQAITGASKATYTPTADLWKDGNTLLQVIEIVTRAGVSGTFASPGPVVSLAEGTLTQTVAPKIVTAAGNYTVSGGTWLPAGDAPTIEWFEDGVSIGTGGSLPIPPGLTSVSVVVTVSRDGYADTTVTLVARKGTITPTVQFISGSHVAQTLSVPDPFVYPATSTPGAVKSYQWYLNGVAIRGATAATLVPSDVFVGRTVTVRVTSTSAFYNTATFTSPGVVIVKADAPLGNPTMISSTGFYQPGAKLSVDTNLPSWTHTGLTFSYQWQISANGGATWATVSTAPTYTLLTTQPTQRVQVVITARKLGYTDRVIVRGNTVIDWLGPLGATTPPQLTGPLSSVSTPVGTALTVTTGFWNAPGLTFSYEWLRDGVTIPGVVGATFTPTAAYYGDQVQVIVTAKAPGYQPASAVSNVVIVGQAAAPTTTPSTVPKITRTGNVLSASTGIWNVDGLTFGYQWRMDGSPIVGATSPTHTISEPGAHVYTVVVTSTRDGYANGTATSVALTATPI